MEITVARLYHPALWKILYSYRVILVILRIFELAFRALRYLVFRAPLLIVWTRLPGLRNRRPPFRELGEVLAPMRNRPSLSVGGGQMGSDFALAQSTVDMSQIKRAIIGSQRSPSRLWSVLGCFVRGFLTDLGPAFIKFGQILSMREEIPPTVKRELQLLQDRLPHMSYQQVIKILERELDRPVEEVFEYVEEAPIAAASLAQVHRAKLRKDREEVAIKIQRPYVQGIAAIDSVIICDVFFGLINLLLPTVRKSSDTSLFTESYRNSLAKEIDFVLEERSQTVLLKHVTNHPIYSQVIKIARTYREYTTTKLLTMELVSNYHRLDRILDELTPQQLRDFATTKVDGLPPDLPLHLVWGLIALQMEGMNHWGLSHGDVHLGNVYALEPQGDGYNWKMFLCDFGMMVEMDQKGREEALKVGCALTYFWDGRMFANMFLSFPGNKTKGDVVAKFADRMESTLPKYLIEPKQGAESIWYPVTQRGTSVNIVSDIMYRTATMGLGLPHWGWPFFKTINYVAVMGLSMWTSFNITNIWASHCKKYVKDIILHELEARNVTDMRDSLPDMLLNLRPYDRKQIMKSLENGDMVRPMEICWGHDWDVRGLLDSQASPSTLDEGEAAHDGAHRPGHTS